MSGSWITATRRFEGEMCGNGEGNLFVDHLRREGSSYLPVGATLDVATRGGVSGDVSEADEGAGARYRVDGMALPRRARRFR